MHEKFDREEPVAAGSERSFGLVIGGFFALVAFAPLLHKEPSGPRLWAILLAILFGGLAFLRPALLRPLNVAWTKLGLLLYQFVNPVVLGIVFYGVVTPLGMLMRARGKDLLRLRRDPAAASYWIAREPPGPSPESMTKQF